MNLVMIQQVKKSHQMFGERTNSTEETSDNNPAQQRLRTQKNVENQLTRMLVAVTSLFLILLVPTYGRFIHTTLVVPDTPEKQAATLLFHISNKLYLTNSGINFFLYCISGQKFRSDLKELLCCSSDSRAVSRESESSGVSFTPMEGEAGGKTGVWSTTQKGFWKQNGHRSKCKKLSFSNFAHWVLMPLEIVVLQQRITIWNPQGENRCCNCRESHRTLNLFLFLVLEYNWCIFCPKMSLSLLMVWKPWTFFQ